MSGTGAFRVEVRPVGPGDVEGLAGLRERVVGRLSAFRGADALVEGTAPSELEERPDRLHLVATIGELVAGELLGSLVPAPAGATACRLEVLATDPELRGVGVGHQLLEAARRWAAAHGATAIEAPALPGDRTTKNFLEAHGMVAHLIVARGPVGPVL